MIKILLVEDDWKIQEIITDYFGEKSNGEMSVICASKGQEGLLYAKNEDFDLLLLDIMIEDMDGYTICRKLRKEKDTPVIFLTAKGREEDIMHGYALGGDDYVVKPFLLSELFAKCNALVRRSKGISSGGILKSGKILANLNTCQVMAGENSVTLPPKEWDILLMLLENQDRVITREHFILRVWGYDFEGNERVLDNHIKKLRKALGKYGTYIVTVPGKGYRLLVNES